MLRSKRAVAIAAVTVAVAGGAGVAVAATSSNSGPSNFLDDVAKHLGISRQKLDDATKAAAIDQVNADLAAGRITKDQADALKKRIESGDVPPLAALRGGGPGFGGRGFGPRGPAGPAGAPGMLKGFLQDGLSAAAKYLGLSESDLRTKLASGQSLADVAKAQKKDVTGLQDAITADAKSRLDKAVADKKLTQAQADGLLSALKSRIDDAVNAKPPAGAPRFRGGERHGGGPRFFF
jgi:hypothetical protein